MREELSEVAPAETPQERDRRARGEARTASPGEGRSPLDAAEARAERAIRALAQKQGQIDLLATITIASNAAQTSEGALQAALEQVCAHTRWPIGHVCMRDGDGLVGTSIWHFAVPDRLNAFRRVSESARFARGEGLAGRVLEAGAPVWIMDILADGNFPRAKLATDAGVRAAFAFPVLSGAEVTAVLEFFGEEPTEPDDALLEVMAIVGTQLGRVIERSRAQAALRSSEERYALAARGANDGLWDWDLVADRLYLSPRWRAMLGLDDALLTEDPREWLDRVHPEDVDHLRAEISAHISGLSPYVQVEYRIKRKDGAYRWMLTRGLAVRSAGRATRMAGSQTDITGHKLSEARSLHNAYHDHLTGLPNRSLFLDLLGRAVARSKRRPDYRFAVMFLDIDRFKTINDSLGHAAGDQLLKGVAKRIRTSLRPSDVVARLGGDEFAILVEDMVDVSDATRVADRVLKDLAAPFRQGVGQQLFSGASVGIAVSATGYDRPEDVLRDADTAMFRAKALGKNRYEVFDRAMHARAVSLLELERDLRRAIERSEFRMVYQPIVSLTTGQVSGLEALIRWQHPSRGLVSPVDFISFAEETGLIVPMGSWALRESCRQALEWQSAKLPPYVAVNLSALQLSMPDLPDEIGRVLAETGLPASALRLEITETVLMANAAGIADVLGRLKRMGVCASIDDFGTGYSSLAYLHRFPVDTLKIDRAFVEDIGSGGETEIVGTIAALAHNLGMRVVAEGVETEGQRDRLRTLKCEFAQGYLFSRPVEQSAVAALLT